MFRCKVESYLGYCKENKRLPNPAGFCRFTRIRREDFRRLREFYPDEYDICESSFIDEALNTKVLNTGSTMSYLASLNGEGEDEGYTIVTNQDVAEDGE